VLHHRCRRRPARTDLRGGHDHGVHRPKYPPQSSLNQQTGEFEGFDIDVATEIANRLGRRGRVAGTVVGADHRRQLERAVGHERRLDDTYQRPQEVLHFTEPYYFTPAVVVVHEDNTSVADMETDLDGAKIGVCSGCTYQQYLEQTLEIKGFTFDFVVDDAEVSGYDTDTSALQDLALGDGTRLDAVMTSATTAKGYADSGKPVKTVGDPVFYEPLAAAFDRSSELDPTSLVEAVDGIVGEMHEDGSLSEMSKEWYDGLDLTVQQ
jgi:polar amino acid transport system substrate-binding protein